MLSTMTIANKWYALSKITIALIVMLSAGCLYGAGDSPVEYYSPDGNTLILVSDANLKGGAVKRIVSVISLMDSSSLAGFVSEPRHTEVYWNIESTRCAVIDAPDKGTIQLYMFSVKKGSWNIRELKPFTAIEEKFYAHFKQAQVVTPWRGAVANLKWLSEKKLKISVEDGLGVHDVYETCKE